jgi:hypothetical protein
MPALPIATNCIQVNTHMILGDDINVENRYHIMLSGAGGYSQAELNAWAEEVHDDFAGDVMPSLANDLVLSHTTSKDLSVLNGGDGLFTPVAPTVGGAGSAALPANCALVASWAEFISYRGGHPRTYLPGIPIGEQSDPQHVASTYATTIQTAMAAFLSSINTGVPTGAAFSGVLVVVHYRLNAAPQIPPQVEPITGVTVNTRIDSQRRRLGS